MRRAEVQHRAFGNDAGHLVEFAGIGPEVWIVDETLAVADQIALRRQPFL